MRFKQLKNNQGFTYIEVIVVVALFSLIATAVGGLFVLFSRAQVKTAVSEKLIIDSRTVLEHMVRTIRAHRIQYDEYIQPVIMPVQSIALQDSDGNFYRYTLIDDDCPQSKAAGILYEINGESAILTGPDIGVEQFDVYITPTKDPFEEDATGNYLAEEQPMVTIQMRTVSAQSDASAEISLPIQTTISSKRYVR
jgi:prepilin-type N-terminal cleavage/methylation domain-containing protein